MKILSDLHTAQGAMEWLSQPLLRIGVDGEQSYTHDMCTELVRVTLHCNVAESATSFVAYSRSWSAH